MAYVYRHIRLDKNIPFYIGIGSDKSGKYLRAYSKQGRNKHWHNIVNKGGYEVEIMIDDIYWSEAQIKEIEFISLYKRINAGGLLCNLTDGGGGCVGVLVSEETRKKQSQKRIGVTSPIKGTKRPQHVIDAVVNSRKGIPSWNKGVPCNEETKKKIGEKNKGNTSWMKGKTHSLEARIKIRDANIGRTPYNKGKAMSKEQREKMNIVYGKRKKSVLQYSLDGNFIKEYESLADVIKQTGFKKGTISGCLAGRKYKSSMGYIWEYK